MKVHVFLSRPLTITVLRFIVGILFILAGYSKIINPAHFSAVIAEYRILPQSLVPVTAVVLPWLELLCGTMLLLNVFARSNALILMVVLAIFIAGISNNILRGIIHDCGCFEFLDSLLGFQEEISLSTILRDLVILFMAFPILLYGSNVFFRKQ
ncbi:MAG: DoxX family membrane protein [Chlorobium sp.]|nr:DoxX family membrane protein [Chlorobium sp.]